MERGRKLRATSRPPSDLTASVNAGNGAGSSEDEDYEAGVLDQPRSSIVYPCDLCAQVAPWCLVGTQRTSAPACLHEAAAES